MKWWDYLIIGVSIAIILAGWLAIIFTIGKKHFKENTLNSTTNLGGLVSIGHGYLSEKEYVFYKALCAVASSMGYVALPKVELCNIIFSSDDKVKKNPAYHRCVDFCLFTDFEFRPVCIVDLYDNTIADQSLFENDNFTQRVVNACKIPVLKQETLAVYIHEDLKKAIENTMATQSRLVVKK